MDSIPHFPFRIPHSLHPHLDFDHPLSLARKIEQHVDAIIDACPIPTPDTPAPPAYLRAMDRAVNWFSHAASIRKTLFYMTLHADTGRIAAEKAAFAAVFNQAALDQIASRESASDSDSNPHSSSSPLDRYVFDNVLRGEPENLELASQLLLEQYRRDDKARSFFNKHRICYPVEAFSPDSGDPLAGFEPLTREEAAARYPRVFTDKLFADKDSMDTHMAMMDQRERDIKANPERANYYRANDPRYPRDESQPLPPPFNPSNPANKPPTYRPQNQAITPLRSNTLPAAPIPNLTPPSALAGPNCANSIPNSALRTPHSIAPSSLPTIRTVPTVPFIRNLATPPPTNSIPSTKSDKSDKSDLSTPAAPSALTQARTLTHNKPPDTTPPP